MRRGSLLAGLLLTLAQARAAPISPPPYVAPYSSIAFRPPTNSDDGLPGDGPCTITPQPTLWGVYQGLTLKQLWLPTSCNAGHAKWVAVSDPGYLEDAVPAEPWHAWSVNKMKAAATQGIHLTDHNSNNQVVGFLANGQVDAPTADAFLAAHPASQTLIPNSQSGFNTTEQVPEVFADVVYDQTNGTAYNSVSTAGFITGTRTSITGSFVTGDTLNWGTLAGCTTTIEAAQATVQATAGSPFNFDTTTGNVGSITSDGEAIGCPAGTSVAQPTSSVVSAGSGTAANYNMLFYPQEPIWTNDNFVSKSQRGLVFNSVPQQLTQGAVSYNKILYVPNIPVDAGHYTIFFLWRHDVTAQAGGNGILEFPSMGNNTELLLGGVHSGLADRVTVGPASAGKCGVALLSSPSMFAFEQAGSTLTCTNQDWFGTGTSGGGSFATTGINIGPAINNQYSGQFVLEGVALATANLTAAEYLTARESLVWHGYLDPGPQHDTVVQAFGTSVTAGTGDTTNARSRISYAGDNIDRPYDLFDSGQYGTNICHFDGGNSEQDRMGTGPGTADGLGPVASFVASNTANSNVITISTLASGYVSQGELLSIGGTSTGLSITTYGTSTTQLGTYTVSGTIATAHTNAAMTSFGVPGPETQFTTDPQAREELFLIGDFAPDIKSSLSSAQLCEWQMVQQAHTFVQNNKTITGVSYAGPSIDCLSASQGGANLTAVLANEYWLENNAYTAAPTGLGLIAGLDNFDAALQDTDISIGYVSAGGSVTITGSPQCGVDINDMNRVPNKLTLDGTHPTRILMKVIGSHDAATMAKQLR